MMCAIFAFVWIRNTFYHYKTCRICNWHFILGQRSTECWSKIWIAQSCVQHTQFLLSKPFWASRPDTMSTTDRYMILLGAPTVPGKKGVSPGFLQRRKQFIKEALTPTKEQKEDEVPYIRPWTIIPGLHERNCCSQTAGYTENRILANRDLTYYCAPRRSELLYHITVQW